jgi:hypothetical protein
VDNSDLDRWRSLDLVTVLPAITDHAKRDSTFMPDKDPRTHRWHVSASGQDFELLLTGPKYWDTRARAGGGGAIDLVMHLTAASFRAAVRRLRATMI